MMKNKPMTHYGLKTEYKFIQSLTAKFRRIAVTCGAFRFRRFAFQSRNFIGRVNQFFPMVSAFTFPLYHRGFGGQGG